MGFSCHVVFLYVLLIFSSFYFEFLTALDTITKSQFIKDPETITSGNSNLKLGFFSPRNSSNRYVGIWYLSESNIIWVANREQPLRDSLGIVTISKDGNLVVMNGEKQVIWSSNLSNFVSNSSAKLLDTGNLVLLDDSAGNTLWESFQHPTDSFMPKMKLSTNIVTGKKVKLTSWKSPSDPSTGNFSVTVERLSIPEVFIWNKTKPHCRTGPWNGWVYLGEPNAKPKYQYDTSFGREDDGTVYVTASSPNGTFDFVFNFLNSQGKLGEKVWKNKKELVINSTFPGNDCDIYGFCGSFGTCNVLSSPICSCLKGFKPNNTEEWSRQSWQSGCVRRVPLQCDRIKNGSEAGKSDGFLKLETAKVPDFAEQSYVSEDTCRSQCLQNCSCTAYAYDAGIGCMSWNGRLIDIRRFTEGGVDLYIKVDYSELDKKRSMTVIIAVSIIVGILIAATCSYFLWTRALKHSAGRKFIEHEIQRMTADAKHDKLEELPLFDFKKVTSATNNFHSANMLGKGGFGLVYKGELQDGQKIAVKRLSRASGQGMQEFMNEVVVISKLQHRNLVRLLGCCIEGEERMLIYEFMPNKSLDVCLFDTLQQMLIDWKKRVNIIEGIARGLLYLHRDSRLRIIHRDLKASNILLDEEMNPKISDFGLAKIFNSNEEEGNTKRVAGTFGYMSPEYAMKGLFSERSDVYSFGVLLLEIVSGKQNTSFYNNEHSLSLVEFAWKLWNEEDIKALIDPAIFDPVFENQILRYIHIGLLCVQELASERPSMTTVVLMLNSEIVNLPPPGQVAFAQRRNLLSLENRQEDQKPNSANNVTLTELQGR